MKLLFILASLSQARLKDIIDVDDRANMMMMFGDTICGDESQRLTKNSKVQMLSWTCYFVQIKP